MTKPQWWTAGGAAFVVAYAALFAFDIESPGPAPPQSGLYQTAGDPKELTVRAWIDTNRLYSNETPQLHWTFENHSGDTRDVEGLQLSTPGFQHTEPQPIAFRLDAGGVKTFDLDLHPTNSGQFRITGRYRDASKVRQEGAVVLGPIQVTTPAGWLVGHAAGALRRIYGVFKDLALPILLAVIAYVFQKKQKERDDKLTDERDLREERQEIWSAQIPRFQDNVERHYLPIILSIRLLRGEFGSYSKSNAPTDEQSQKLLYHLLLFLRRMRYLRDQKGGIFLQVRTAESVFQRAWFAVNYHVENRLGPEQRDQALRLVRPDMNLHDFRKTAEKREHKKLFQDLRDHLRDWVKEGANPAGGFLNCVDLADVMFSVLNFEINRLFDRYWYDGTPEFEMKKLDEYHFPAVPDEQIGKLNAELPNYVKDVTAYLEREKTRKAAAMAQS